MSLIKIPLILCCAIATHVAATPPNPPPKDSDELPKYTANDLSKLVVAWTPRIMKIAYWLVSVSEIGLILASNFPSHPMSELVLKALPVSSGPASFRLSGQYFLGSLFVIANGLIRHLSFRALGALFTFNLTIRNQHRLVVTGPYSVVRHPAYSGLVMFTIGVPLLAFARGSLIMETGILNSMAGSAAIYGALGIVALIAWSFTVRLFTEDEVLKQEFGHEWEVWAEKVPYRLFPGIY